MPFNKFDRHCREWYLYHLVKINTDGDENDIQMLDDGRTKYALYF